MVDIVEGISPINYLDDYDITLVGTNCYQVMRNGFPYEIAVKYPYVQVYNDSTKYADNRKLGNYVECVKENKPLIILGFISYGYNFQGNDKCFVDYDAIKRLFRLLNLCYKGKHIATTMLGTTKFDGNADKEKILQIINDESKSIDVTIFDYKQESGPILKQKEYYKKLKNKRND